MARLFGWLALVVALVLQVAGLYSTSPPQPGGVPGLDKIAHLAAFAVPAGLAWLLRARWMVGVLVVHALVSEPLQHQLAPRRELDGLDTLADLVGIAAGVVLARALLRRSGHDGRVRTEGGRERR